MAQSEQNTAGPVEVDEVDEVDEWSVVEEQSIFTTTVDNQAGTSASTRLVALVSRASHATGGLLTPYRTERNSEHLFLREEGLASLPDGGEWMHHMAMMVGILADMRVSR